MGYPVQAETREARSLYIQTFGCQMNDYDSLRVQHMLATRGYQLTLDVNEADIIFLNTCSVREKAEQKVYSFLGRLRSAKVENPALRIIVGGCLAQQLGKKLLQKFDHLDLVLGTRAIDALPRLLDVLEQPDKRLAYLPEEEKSREDFFEGPYPFSGKVVAPVTIMQGCDNFCTYCIVPYVRGRERSRPSAEIIREIRWLVSGGIREVLLLGQNVNSYGRGLDERITFPELLHRIAAETDLARVRFTTSHPKDLTYELMRCFAEVSSLGKHLHLPFQAGSDRILKRMGRGYTAREYLEKIDRLRNIFPDIAISSDAMVGFPGESEEDYRQTLNVIEQVQFDGLFSFRYSDRPFARASDYPNKVPEAIKARWLNDLQALQAAITLRKNEAEIGCVRQILVEGPSRASKGQLTGRTEQNRIVNFDGPEELIGRLVFVKIIAAFSHSLKGELVLTA